MPKVRRRAAPRRPEVILLFLILRPRDTGDMRADGRAERRGHRALALSAMIAVADTRDRTRTFPASPSSALEGRYYGRVTTVVSRWQCAECCSVYATEAAHRARDSTCSTVTLTDVQVTPGMAASGACGSAA